MSPKISKPSLFVFYYALRLRREISHFAQGIEDEWAIHLQLERIAFLPPQTRHLYREHEPKYSGSTGIIVAAVGPQP